MSTTLPVATQSCAPWRKTDIKNSGNEVYVNLVEEIDAIVRRFTLKLFLVLFSPPITVTEI